MKKIYLIRNWWYISLLILFFLSSCKKINYKETTVRGRIVNLATNEGIANALVTVKSYTAGGFPDKSINEIAVRADEQGYYSITFEAKKHWLNKDKNGSYAVEYDTEGKITSFRTGEGGTGKTVDLMKYFNDDLLTYQHIEKLGEINDIDIKVVLEGRFFFQFYNDKPLPTSADTMEVRNKNRFVEYYLYGTVGEINNSENSFLYTYPWSFTTGENTISYYITKNGAKTRVDTTFFVEPKDYYINFHF
jgi:hypothetical protein